EIIHNQFGANSLVMGSRVPDSRNMGSRSAFRTPDKASSFLTRRATAYEHEASDNANRPTISNHSIMPTMDGLKPNATQHTSMMRDDCTNTPIEAANTFPRSSDTGLAGVTR